MFWFAFFTLLFLCSLNGAVSEVYHIVPSSKINNDLCPASCLTLSQFAKNSSSHLHVNTTLVFQPGIHHLTINLTLSLLYNFTMNVERPLTTVEIKCTRASHILLSSIQHIYISSLKFVGCEGNQVERVQQFVLRDVRFEGRERSGSALQLIETSAQTFNTTFIFNIGVCIIDMFSMPVCHGGAIFANHSKINLTQSRFEQNIAHVGGAIIANRAIIYINNCTFSSNRAEAGGSLAIVDSTLIIEGSEFNDNGAIQLDGGGVLVSFRGNISINESKFIANFANFSGGVFSFYDSNLAIVASGFYGNFAAENGGVLYSSNSNIRIHACKFDSNSALRDGGIIQSDSSAIAIEECSFENNFVAHHGGVLFTSTDLNDIKVDDSNFTNNSFLGLWIPTTTDQIINEVYYITADSGDTCTMQCLTLSRFASNISYNPNHYLGFNISLVLLPGMHYLTVNLVITNVEILSVSSWNSTAQIFCKNHSSMYFLYSQYIEITNLEFIGCGGNEVINVAQFVLQGTTFIGHNKSETSLELIKTTGTVINSTFVSNRNGKTKESIEVGFNLYFGPRSVGGTIIAAHSIIDIIQSTFRDNQAEFGGVIFAEKHSVINMTKTTFINNIDAWTGGVLYSASSSITINTCTFNSNTAIAGSGGALYLFNSNIIIEASKFDENVAHQTGGVLYCESSNVILSDCDFTNNNSTIGAVLYSRDSRITYRHSLQISNNSADSYAVIYLTNSEFYGQHSANAMFSNNLGSLVAFSSNIVFLGNDMFASNHPPRRSTDNLQEGGAITLFESNIIFNGTCNLKDNYASNGGAIFSTGSTLHVSGSTIIAQNMVTQNGGGLYLSNSEVNLEQNSTLEIVSNIATHKGGGVHAISSTIKIISDYIQDFSQGIIFLYTGAKLYFIRNIAEKGGGLSMEGTAKLYVLKYSVHIFALDSYDTNTTRFTANVADYGGAIYVDDNSNSGTCASVPKTECFFQVLANYDINTARIASLGYTQSLQFTQNLGRISGSTLYGGLLDRCSVGQFAEVVLIQRYQVDAEHVGIAYFQNISIPKKYDLNEFGHAVGEEVIAQNDISSLPVQVCPCIDNKVECMHQPNKEVKKGETFIVSLAAVDQISKPINATIQTSLRFTESGLAEGQLMREITGECTDLIFNIVSPHNFESLTLYASDGPCKDAPLSVMKVDVQFLPCCCPIGLQIIGTNSINCTCECHIDIREYVEECDSLTGSVVISSQSRAWISFVNETDLTGYLVYSNCPFDYCHSLSLSINLNEANGADAQCAFNRSSLLCGSCLPGLSISLGSSRCLLCPRYWPVLLIVISITAILAGIALVAILLLLNMTVAIGTLNGLFFYCNIVHANRNILLPFVNGRPNFITVLVSWLNLELGIDMCYFPGMDTYTKTWLQLVFPAYVILLVALVIVISSYSTRFSNLIGKKDPVATLATLILLMYAKLLEICFKSLTIGILTYPDGSKEWLWLPDAIVKYLSGKHIPLFIAAVLILLVGLVYTALLFSWQWLLYLPKWRILQWSRNPKIQTFIEMYHTPYIPKHRYWTGVLLISRIVLYLVAAANVSNDPIIAFTAITFTVCCIFGLRLLIGNRVYRKWPVDVLETIFYFNILSFAIFAWYSLDNPDTNQEAAAYTSFIITFIILLLIVLYHVYTYTTVFSKVKNTKLGRVIDWLFADNPKPKPPQSDDGIHQFNDLLNMSDRPIMPRPVKPTQTIVEVHHPYITPPDPKEVSINTQHAHD